MEAIAPVTLAEIKAEPRLSKMELIRQSRLSVAPVADREWETILEMAGDKRILLLLASASLASETPRAFIERIYAHYRNEHYSPFDHPEQVFAPRLKAAIKDDEQLAHGEVGFDGDPVCDRQDTGGMHSRIVSCSRLRRNRDCSRAGDMGRNCG